MSLQSLETVATIVAGVVATGGVVAALVRYGRPRVAAWLQRQHAGLTVELIPIHFAVFLGKPFPSVTLTLRAVNYLRAPIVLESIRIRFLHLGNSSGVDEITSPDEYEIPARHSREVSCQRKLIESEAAALRSLSPRQRWWQGSVMCSARGVSGRREVRFDSSDEFAIYGTVEGLAATA